MPCAGKLARVPELISVVGAALIRDGRVLASRRTGPPRLAGCWEFPGGKVEDGETDQQALVRELREELQIESVVGARLGPDLVIGTTAVLRVYLVSAVGAPQLVDHDAHRWLAEGELEQVPWLPIDLPLLPVLRRHLLSR